MSTFDDSARDWDADPMKVERARIVAEAIRGAVLLQPGMKALEYGCGTGLLSFALQADLASITLADSSQGMLDVLSGKIKSAGVTNMHPLRLNLVTDPLPALRCDIIFSLMTLHHVPDTLTLLRRFQVLLEPGGLLCLADLEKEDGSFHGAGMPDVHPGFERPRLQTLVESAGFRNVCFTNVYEIRKKIGAKERFFSLFLMTAAKIPG